MKLPIKTSYAPMEAKSVDAIPTGDGWQYEPKWDGFRCIAFRDAGNVELQSKSGQPLGRYFPEAVAAIGGVKAKKFVLDGELVVPVDGRLSFDDLLQRIHPAESRIRKLAASHPSVYVVFDLLVDERGKSLVDEPLNERRKALDSFAKKYLAGVNGIMLSPATRDIAVAREWLGGVGSTIDGVIAKHLEMNYRSGLRDGMVKIKKMRTAECVVGGFRYGSKATKILGSLLLGLYDDKGLLNHVGFTSSLTEEERKELTPKIERLKRPIAKGGGFTGKAPGGPSRWSTERSGEWEAVDPKLVVEVRYDHFTQGRFRHGTKLLRWRPDKSPRLCMMDQVAGSAVTGKALRIDATAGFPLQSARGKKRTPRKTRKNAGKRSK